MFLWISDGRLVNYKPFWSCSSRFHTLEAQSDRPQMELASEAVKWQDSWQGRGPLQDVSFKREPRNSRSGYIIHMGNMINYILNI